MRPPASTPRCALCPSPATDIVGGSSGNNVPVCDACGDGLTHAPTVPLPGDAGYNPVVHSLLAAVLDALVEGVRGEWRGGTFANDRFDTGEAA